MQVAKKRSEIKNMDPRDQDCHFILKEDGEIEGKVPKIKPGPKKFAEWVKYPLNRKITEVGKHKYEWFCAGYLYYYDMEVRNGSIDHIIKFTWGTDNKSVLVELYPAPLKRLKSGSPGGVVTDPAKPPGPPPPPMG